MVMYRQQKYMHDAYVVCLLHLLHIDWQVS